MSLVERLEAKRREVDRRVRSLVYLGDYDHDLSDLRDLLEQVQRNMMEAVCSCPQCKAWIRSRG